MLRKIAKSVKSVFSKKSKKMEPVVDAVIPVTAKTSKKIDRSKLTSFQIAAGYAALMKYQQDKLSKNVTHSNLDEMYAELNQRLGTNKSRAAWTIAITQYMRTLDHKGE